jgi:hypothetical protein
MSYLGDFAASDIIDFKFTTRRDTGAPFALASGAISVYKSNSTTQSTTGVTLTADFDSVTGLNHVRIDTSLDGTFYADGSQFDVVITTGTVNSISVVGEVVGRFTLRAQASLYPTTAGRKLDVSAGGEAGIDWANIGSPTTTVNFSGTTIKTATDVETDTADIQTRLPAALVGGRMDSDMGAISTDSVAADNAEAFFDGTGYAGTNNVIPLVTTTTTVTNMVSANVTQISGDSVAADNAESFFDGTGYAGTNNVIPTVTSVTNGVTLTASQLFIKKNTALSNFEFLMTDSTNHNPATGLTVTGTVSIDGAAFASLTNSVTEVANGIYKINLAAADVNGTVITLRFVASGADDQLITIITQA